MRITGKCWFWVLVFSCIFFPPQLSNAGRYIAFSLNAAAQNLKTGCSHSEVTSLAGITRPFAIVYDEKRQDIILVGEKKNRDSSLHLDDFIVAMRAILKHHSSPLVSIDQTKDTKRSGKQKVRFEGGIENTAFGKALLDADITLKKIGLGKIKTGIWGVQSYFDMSAEDWEHTGKESSVTSRFWFIPSKNESYVGVRKGVAVVDRLRITVKTEVMSKGDVKDEIGDRFALMLAANFDDLSVYYSPLQRLAPLFRFTGLAEAIDRWREKYGIPLSNIDFWLNEYSIRHVQTPRQYPLIAVNKVLKRSNTKREMTVTGGIKLDALVLELQDKSLNALKELVILSRPQGDSMAWEVPLDYWGMPGIAKNSGFRKRLQSYPQARKLAMSLEKHFSVPGGPYISTPVISMPLSSSTSDFNFVPELPTRKISTDIGGVMLQGVAKIKGAEKARCNLTKGNFSLIVDGKEAQLDPQTFRKFVTALWSVYFTDQDPGISIDPIAPNAKKHMVRYIGKVVNTDLGRVMRQADYMMKQWSVGTARPDFNWFKNPDDISAERGVVYVGAWSRFWFVPEGMTFRRSGNMLLFDNGAMKVKTEYMFKSHGMRADPANEEFARLLTTHYSQLENRYPVYKELFEYAKLVSLTKYLKQQGVPLFWFLMANKDLVLTEDSPGTVDALAKGSEHFKGIYIKGGVDLGGRSNYVYDAKAVEAIREAASRLLHPNSNISLKTRIASIEDALVRSTQGLTFDTRDRSYTVVASDLLTSGMDRRGIRYQTDIAVRWKGFRCTQKSLDRLKAILFYKSLSDIIGPTDKLDDLKPEFDSMYHKAMGEAEKIVAKLKPLVGQTFDTDQRLARAMQDLLGPKRASELKPFMKKFAYSKTNLEIVRFYNPDIPGTGEFGSGWRLLVPYDIRPEGRRTRKFRNILLPEKMAVVNLLTDEKEVLTFNTDRYDLVGYVPDKVENSQLVGLFLISDGSFRLADKLGNEFHFDQSGHLTDMIFSENSHIHLDYTTKLEHSFESPPYHIRPAGDQTIEFLNAIAPARLEVVDLANGKSEILVFKKEGDIAGYIPENKKDSRFRILAIMTDASFRLLDRHGNEMSFDSAGDFDSCESTGKPVIRSISQGRYRVDFKYTVDPDGNLIVSASYLTAENENMPIYIVHYQYDSAGRLIGMNPSVSM